MDDPHRKLEHLRKLATANPTQRFGKLLKIIRHESFLQLVWQQVRTHKGSRAPDVDGQTKMEVGTPLLHTLAHELATRQYRPQPVRRTYIPKRGKSGQWRGLGIPAIAIGLCKRR